MRSGQATAAPVASGMPRPIEPPMLFSQSCGGAPAVVLEEAAPGGDGLVGDDGALGQQRAERSARALSGVRRRSGSAGRLALLHDLAVLLRAHLVGEPLERRERVLGEGGEPVDLAAVGRSTLGLSG